MNKDNIYFSLKYAILGDIIGFGNGDVEFNFFKNNKIKNDKDYQNFLDNNFTEVHIYNFINDGGLHVVEDVQPGIQEVLVEGALLSPVPDLWMALVNSLVLLSLFGGDGRLVPALLDIGFDGFS